MNEEEIESIRETLLDLIDNSPKPDNFASHDDYKREWLLTVADVSAALAKGIKP